MEYIVEVCVIYRKQSLRPVIPYKHKTKGAFEVARGAIQTYGSLGSLNNP